MTDTVTRELLKAEAHPEQPVLEVINLTKRFEVNGTAISVLDDLSFSAGIGEMVCIAGRSGCGKTTLLNILAGFLKPSAGTVLVNGEPILQPGPDRCVVFQEDTLFPWLIVRENIAFGLKRRAKDKRLLSISVCGGGSITIIMRRGCFRPLSDVPSPSFSVLWQHPCQSPYQLPLYLHLLQDVVPFLLHLYGHP